MAIKVIKGGKRLGAGRKKGEPNKKTAAKIAAIEASGLTPLDYMLDRLRDKDEDPKVRREMAISSAPYVHPRLSAIEHSGDKDKPIAISNLTPEQAYKAMLEG